MRFLAAPSFPLVSALPTAADHEGEVLRTTVGLFWSDGTDWRRVDAPGTFVPLTSAEYAALTTDEQNDPSMLYLIVTSATGLRPTTTWTEVTSAPGSPDAGTLYVVNP